MGSDYIGQYTSFISEQVHPGPPCRSIRLRDICPKSHTGAVVLRML